MTMLHVEAAVAGRKRSGAPDHALVVALSAGPTSLRDLIEAIVTAEVGAFLTRAGDERVVQVLTEEALADGLTRGSVRSGGRERADDVDADVAVRTALEAHQDGLFQTIVDDVPLDDLDELVSLRDGTRVMFVRLVPLSGG